MQIDTREKFQKLLDNNFLAYGDMGVNVEQ